jgi:hypothetical protein
MRTITPFDPSATASGKIQTNLANACAVLYLINESHIGIKLTFADGSTGVVPAWFTRAFRLTTPNAPVEWSQLYTLNASSTPTNPLVFGEGYEPNEVDWRQLATGPLTRQINVGNTIPVASSTTSVVNDGNAANTSVVEATQSGAGGSNLLIENDGTISVKEGTTTLLDLLKIIPGATIAVLLGSATRAVQAVGDLFMSTGKLGVTAAGDVLDASSATVTNLKARTAGTINLQSPDGTTQAAVSSAGLILTAGKVGVSTAGDVIDASSATTTYVKARSTGNVTFQTPDGTSQGSFNSNGMIVNAGKIGVAGAADLIDANGALDTYIKTRTGGGNIHFQVPGGTDCAAVGGGGLSFSGMGTGITWKTGDTLSGTHTFTGAATGTYTHGAGGTPFMVLPMQQTSGSQTMGYDSITSTQVHITSGAGNSFKALTLLG